MQTVNRAAYNSFLSPHTTRLCNSHQFLGLDQLRLGEHAVILVCQLAESGYVVWLLLELGCAAHTRVTRMPSRPTTSKSGSAGKQTCHEDARRGKKLVQRPRQVRPLGQQPVQIIDAAVNCDGLELEFLPDAEDEVDEQSAHAHVLGARARVVDGIQLLQPLQDVQVIADSGPRNVLHVFPPVGCRVRALQFGALGASRRLRARRQTCRMALTLGRHATVHVFAWASLPRLPRTEAPTARNAVARGAVVPFPEGRKASSSGAARGGGPCGSGAGARAHVDGVAAASHDRVPAAIPPVTPRSALATGPADGLLQISKEAAVYL